MEILPLTKEHKKPLADLLLSYWNSRTMKYSEKWVNRYLEEGHRIEIIGDQFFIALEGEEVVGSMSLVFWEGNRAEMRDFYVKPELRGKGVGEKLFERVMKECQSRGVKKVFAFVLVGVEDFFLKRGFEKEGLLKHHFKNGEDMIAIGKRL